MSRGVVAAGDPHTAEAAAEILRAGGNAVDAAVAGALAAFVAEPLLASAGGAGMLTAALDNHPPAVVDFFSPVPGLGDRPEHLDFIDVEVDFGSATQTFHVGRGSAAVPLALPGLATAAQRFGTRPLSELVAPAVRMARSGVPLSEAGAYVFDLLEPIVCRDPAANPILAPGGRPHVAGASMKNDAMADALEEYGRTGAMPAAMRRGILDGFGPARGGLITEADLDRDYVEVVDARRMRVGDWEVLTSPQVGGALVERIVRALAAETPHPDEADELLRRAEASRAGHRERGALTAPGSTTHISVVSPEGGAAAVTLTNGEGCGHLIGDTGIQLNNFLGEEDLNPHGFHRHSPGSRLPTMIAPTVALCDGAPALALGSGGSNRIRSSVSLALYRVVVAGEPVSDAVLGTRVHAEDDDVWLERAALSDPDRAVEALRERFARVHPFPDRAFFFGGVHAVQLADGKLSGIGDPRRGGAAVEA